MSYASTKRNTVEISRLCINDRECGAPVLNMNVKAGRIIIPFVHKVTKESVTIVGTGTGYGIGVNEIPTHINISARIKKMLSEKFGTLIKDVRAPSILSKASMKRFRWVTIVGGEMACIASAGVSVAFFMPEKFNLSDSWTTWAADAATWLIGNVTGPGTVMARTVSAWAMCAWAHSKATSIVGGGARFMTYRVHAII